MRGDRTFYERRRREELARSTSEQDASLQALHRRLASLYEARLNQLPPEFSIAA